MIGRFLAPGARLRTVVLLVGLHSCALGAGMLLVPRTVLGLMGYGEVRDLFFPSQAGIFLLILGVCYLRALRHPALVEVILISKALAVAFLLAHALLLGAPPVIAAAAAGDGAMLAAVLWARATDRRALSPDPAGGRADP